MKLRLMITGLKTAVGSLLDLGDNAPAYPDVPVEYPPTSTPHLITKTTPKHPCYIAPTPPDTLSWEPSSPLVIGSPIATLDCSLLGPQEDHPTKSFRASTVKMTSDSSDISETSRKRSAEGSPVTTREAKRVKN